MADLFGNVAAEPRPTQITDEMLHRVAEKLLPEVLRWLSDGGGMHDRDNVERDLVDILKSGGFHSWDPYKLTKALEDDHGWECDSKLSEILEQADNFISDERTAAINRWIKANNIQPVFAKNDAVQFSRKGSHGEKTYTGTILEVYPDTASYLVNVPAMGHMTLDELRAHKTGTRGTYVPFESANPCA
jgi:hypothetical protein